MRRLLFTRRFVVLGTVILAAGRLAQAAAAGDGATVAARELVRAADEAKLAAAEAQRVPMAAAKLRLGTWRCIGPFKDAEYGVFSREFDTPLGPEKDIVERGSAAADLEKIWLSVPLVGQSDRQRRWEERPDYVDGYFHEMPVGPPPSRNEVVYLHRTITAARSVSVVAHLVLTDAAKVWVNGKLAAEAPIRQGAGQRALHVRAQLPLREGDNQLLVKIVSCFQRHGFSFAVEGLHPISPYLVGQPMFHDRRSFSPAYEPFASAMQPAAERAPATRPAWYVRRETWQETLVASRAEATSRLSAAEPALPWSSPIMRPKEPARRLRFKVAGLKKLALACTIAGDSYDFDDSIWADSRLIAPDGRETWLVDLKPVTARVGYAELFVNKNLTGKPLQIGERTFARGFWAHAPSVLEFDLSGQYEWFDTWIGVDALAAGPGTCEFQVAASVEDLRCLDSRGMENLLVSCLLADFPGVERRHEIEREMADGIWSGILAPPKPTMLRERYSQCLATALGLPVDRLQGLPADAGAVREVYHQVKRIEEARKKIEMFCTEVQPMPGFDPSALRMQSALDNLAPSAGGAAYLQRLAPVANLIEEARAAGDPEKVLAAGAAIDRFRAASVRSIGPIVFVRRPSCGRINGVDPYNWPRGGPADIAVFDPAQPERPPRLIYHDPVGSIYDMSLSFDAKTIFFSARRPGVAGGWQIYEIGVDGTGLRQITRETRPDSDAPLSYGGFHHPKPNVDNNISPVELPSGELLFVSSRAGNVLVCQPGRAAVLYTCRRDGGNVRRISANTLSDHTPTVMEDGRVMFTRWDYGVDKGVFERHGVWTMNPDGSRLQLFFGNTLLDPNAFWQCRPVPGRPEVLSSFGGHHAGPYGVVGVLWNRLGLEAGRGEGFRFATPEYPTYYDGNFWFGYMDPQPLNEHEFLVSYGGDGERRSRICLLDDRGNRTCIWEEADMGSYCPMPLRTRLRPPVIAPACEPVEFSYVDPVERNRHPDARTGTLFVADVYEGLGASVRRGEVKAIQIMEQVPKTRPHTGGYAWNVTPTIGRGTFYVRRLIGQAPVAADGSAHFTAPALRDISFNLLDSEGRVIQKMGSTTQIMPDETHGCIGCHETRTRAVAARSAMPLAVRREPSTPVRPDWGTDGIIDYVKVVQPVWDRHCVRCHSGATPSGGLDLSGDKTRYFNMSYDMLIDRGLVHHIPMNGADHDLTTPKSNGSLASPIARRLEGAGPCPPAPAEDRQRIYTWIDANVPYYHTYLYTDGTINGARDRWFANRGDGWFRKEFDPVFRRRCFDCHQRSVDISDAWLGRTVLTVTSKVWTDTTLMDQGLQIEPAVAVFGPEYRINLTHPEWSQMLTAPLARSAGGLGMCRDKEGNSVFANTDDADYQAMLGALQHGKRHMEEHPGIDR